MDIHGQLGLKQDQLKLKEEMLYFKIKDVGPMDYLLNLQLIMLMLQELFNSYNKMLLDSLQTMLVLNQLKRLKPQPTNCQHTVISSNKMLYRNSNHLLKLKEKVPLVNKSFQFWETYKLNQKQLLPHYKNKKFMLPSHLPNLFQILMLKLHG